MTQDRIIEMARELVTKHGTRLCDEDGETHGYELYCVGIEDIADIIKEVAAHEREACAKVASGYNATPWNHCQTSTHAADMVSASIAAAIRARSNNAT